MKASVIEFFAAMRPHFRVQAEWTGSFRLRCKRCPATCNLMLGENGELPEACLGLFYEHADTHRRHPWPWPMTPICSRIVALCINCRRHAVFRIVEWLPAGGDWSAEAIHGCVDKRLSFLQRVTPGAGRAPLPTGEEERDYINRQLVAIWEGEAENTMSATLRRHGQEDLAKVHAGIEPRAIVDGRRRSVQVNP
jgi:hypothetical protein